ncbi:MAG TPA: porin [Burkholderiaceae bacterium]|nr:porin [Burkholderiaceae bacterium]
MQKKFAFLVLASIASQGAYCQSSVTLFGVVDSSVSYTTGSLSHKVMLNPTGGGLFASRIGFRGEEDLGSGARATFWLEASLQPDSGIGAASNTNNQSSGAATTALNGGQGLVFNRRATVSLAGPWGEVRLGRANTPAYLNIGVADPYFHTGLGASQTLQGTSVLGPAYVRASNLVYYISPRVGGLFGEAAYFLGENASNATNRSDGSGSSFRFGYETPDVTLSAGYQRARFVTGDTVNRSVLGILKLPVVKLSAGYQWDTVRGPAPDARGWTVGAVVPLNAWEFRAVLSQYQLTGPGNPRSRKLVLGSNYALSKRTTLYATAAQINNGGTASQALAGSTTRPGDSSSGVELGINHRF